MTELYKHQQEGVAFLAQRKAAMLCDEMGLGKTRQALCAAQQLFSEYKIDRVLVLAPAAVRYSWLEEVKKLSADGQHLLIWCAYDAKKEIISGEKLAANVNCLMLLVVSYSLLPQVKHVKALSKWAAAGSTLLVCDESSFLKNRTAKQTLGSLEIAQSAARSWLLTGTPVANSPLDLWSQGLVMSASLNGHGPLRAFKSFYHFRARYAVLKMMNVGRLRFQQVVAYQNLSELTKRLAPYVLRREKKDCLDLPSKTYVVREVALDKKTWAIYQELRREAMLCLPDTEERPEPNAAVRILRLCQLTSGHVTMPQSIELNTLEALEIDTRVAIRDVSSEKLDWLASEIIDGELSSVEALIVWCRWRRERERLKKLLEAKRYKNYKDGEGPLLFPFYEIYGGQSQKDRDEQIQNFQRSSQYMRCVLLAQPHAGGFGLNLTAASTAVYLSNDFSYTTRVQSEDRCHRIGQTKQVLYIDVVATGPSGQRTVDHHVLAALREKRSIAEFTTRAWRKALSDE